MKEETMTTIYDNFDCAELATKIGDALEIDANGVATLPNAQELFAASLPEGLTVDQVNQSYDAVANFNQATAAALGHAIACEIKEETELGKTVSSFVYAGNLGNLSHNVAATVTDNQISFTSELVNPNDTTNALFQSLTEGFAAFVAAGE